MATVHARPEFLIRPVLRMNAVSHPFKSKLRLFSPNLRGFCTPSLRERAVRNRPKVRVRAPDSELKENWLDSLSCPFQGKGLVALKEPEEICSNSGPHWVVGIDPDVSGALALLKDDSVGCSAQVFDTPHLQVLVGKRVRRRLDARSIVQMLHNFGAPLGTTAYIEQSNPFPQDGKQGWWSGGFTYGLWIGILVSSGFSVVPVSSRLWKDQFQLLGNSSSKDDSRKAASDLFPSLSSSLKRKKDHGRAEALLIAAYGRGLRIQSTQNTTSSVPLKPTVSLE